MPRPSPRRAVSSVPAFAFMLVIVIALGLFLTTSPAAAEEPEGLPPGWLLYDGGALLEPGAVAGAVPLELAIDYFTVGDPAVRWRTDIEPLVDVCTVHANRPARVSAEEFRESVLRGIEVWSRAEAAVGFEYTGDCGTSSWSQGNFINEIGWDDERNIVRSPAAGITFGRWADRGFSRDFQETDIILDHAISVSRQCLDSVVAHELGHVLGFGHSDRLGDLMYPSFDPADDRTCPGVPRNDEVVLLRALYGENKAPSFASSDLDHAVGAGRNATIRVAASDPEGDTVTYHWMQTGGPRVVFTALGGAINYVAPDIDGATLRFALTATDRFGHSTTAEVVVHVIESLGPPSEVPFLEGLRVSPDGARLALKFTESGDAFEYQFCATPLVFSAPSCRPVAAPLAEITWDTVLPDSFEVEVPAGSPLVVTSGVRTVELRACNAEGCVQDDATRILAGGLRWGAHRIDFDYLTMTQDLGSGENDRFTIVLVQNMTGTARNFALYSGSETDPLDTALAECDRLVPGDFCFGFLAPGDSGHGTHVTIRSERGDSPVIENRIRVR